MNYRLALATNRALNAVQNRVWRWESYFWQLTADAKRDTLARKRLLAGTYWTARYTGDRLRLLSVHHCTDPELTPAMALLDEHVRNFPMDLAEGIELRWNQDEDRLDIRFLTPTSAYAFITRWGLIVDTKGLQIAVAELRARAEALAGVVRAMEGGGDDSADVGGQA